MSHPRRTGRRTRALRSFGGGTGTRPPSGQLPESPIKNTGPLPSGPFNPNPPSPVRLPPIRPQPQFPGSTGGVRDVPVKNTGPLPSGPFNPNPPRPVRLPPVRGGGVGGVKEQLQRLGGGGRGGGVDRASVIDQLRNSRLGGRSFGRPDGFNKASSLRNQALQSFGRNRAQEQGATRRLQPRQAATDLFSRFRRSSRFR